jgi:hypothetical protein
MPSVKEMEEELRLLQLEEAREVAQGRKQNRMSRENKIKAIEFSLKRDREMEKLKQEGCVHRKGGKGRDGIYNGNDSNYAVITHTLSHGPTIVVCQRCGKLWEPPARLRRGATQEQRAQYSADLLEYRRAIALPTDNEPSGTVLFGITTYEGEAA